MKKDRDCRIIRLGDRILRILDAEGEKALVIDCVKMGMPLPGTCRQRLIWQCIYRTLPGMRYIPETQR